MSRSLISLTLLVVAIGLHAQTPDHQAGNKDTGRIVFSQHCSFCHGIDATGGEGPNLILSSVVRHDKQGDLIGEVIQNGRPEKGMPVIPLTNEQTRSVIEFLHTRVQESDRRSAGKPDAGYPLARLNTGDAAIGRTLFGSRCSTCHSPQGDLSGIATRYSPVELQSRFLYPKNVPVLVTVHDRNGKVLSGTLLYSDPFTIAMRDENGGYHSWPPSAVHVDTRDPLEEHRTLLGTYTESDMHNLFAYLESLK